MKPDSSTKARRSSFLFGTFHYESETLLYVLLSAVDLFVTYFLLRQEADNLQFVESNPFAKFFLDRWGVKGMIYFKFGMVALVCVVTQIIARWRPRTARLVLWFAIVVMIYVVVYSIRLYQEHGPGGSGPAEESFRRPVPRVIIAEGEIRRGFAQTGLPV